MKLKTILKSIISCNQVQILDNTCGIIACDYPKKLLQLIKTNEIQNSDVSLIESSSEIVDQHSEDEITIVLK